MKRGKEMIYCDNCWLAGKADESGYRYCLYNMKYVERQLAVCKHRVTDTGIINAKATAGGHMEVYEVVDATCDEHYLSLGFFLSLEEAKAAVLIMLQDDYPVSGFADEDYEKIEIRRRPLGWSNEWGKVYSVERKAEYDEKTDDAVWTVI